MEPAASAFRRFLLRHLPPVIITTGFIVGGWMILTLPIVAVFVVDREFAVRDYLTVLLTIAAWGLAFSVVVLCPLAALIDRLSRRNPRRTAVFVIGIPVLAGLYWLLRMLVSHDRLRTLASWPSILLAFTALLAAYVGILWAGQALRRMLRRP